MAMLKLHVVLLKTPTSIGVDCDDPRWKYFEIHPNCKNLYGIPFPHFHALAEVYGKDYATGKPAEDFVEAIGNMQKSIPIPITCDSSDDEDTLTSGNDHQLVESSPPLKKIKTENNSKRKGGKKEGGKARNPGLATL